MGARKLATYVHVDGTAYGPDSDVPADVAKRITNPKAWGDESEAEGKKAPAKKAASGKSDY